jgi:hypothetical protein
MQFKDRWQPASSYFKLLATMCSESSWIKILNYITFSNKFKNAVGVVSSPELFGHSFFLSFYLQQTFYDKNFNKFVCLIFNAKTSTHSLRYNSHQTLTSKENHKRLKLNLGKQNNCTLEIFETENFKK